MNKNVFNPNGIRIKLTGSLQVFQTCIHADIRNLLSQKYRQ